MEIERLQVLRTDASGMPLEWIGYQEAAKLYYLGQVAYACGSRLFTLRGGCNAKTGQRSLLEINSILATHSHDGIHKVHENYRPPLSNPALFRRDDHHCLYCGQRFHAGALSRDHITPISQRGQDAWNNVVTACKRCNNRSSHVRGHGTYLRVRHQATRTEHLTQSTYDTHGIRGCNGDVEIEETALDLLGQIFKTNSVCTSSLGSLGSSTLCEHSDALGLASALR